MNTKNSINESLEVIRRALEDEKNDSNKHSSSNILILNQKVNSDGTIKLLQKDEEINSEINDIIDQKLSYLVENKIEKYKKKQTNSEVLDTKVLKEGDEMYIQWNSNKLTIYIWDANTEDGDKVNLSINDKIILSDYITRKKRKKIKHHLKRGENKIKIEAINVGENPPNTSRIELVDLKIKYPVITQLEVGKSAVITIIK